MKNYMELVSSIIVYDVMFDGVQYEVQTSESSGKNEILAIYRADGSDLSDYEEGCLIEFIYKQID